MRGHEFESHYLFSPFIEFICKTKEGFPLGGMLGV